MSSPYDSRFEQELFKRLTVAVNDAREELGNGSQISADAGTTGMKCAKYIGHIAGLNEALKKMQEVHDFMYGKGK